MAKTDSTNLRVAHIGNGTKNNHAAPTVWPFRGISYAEYMALSLDDKTRLDSMIMGFVLGAAPIKADVPAAKPPLEEKPHLRLISARD